MPTEIFYIVAVIGIVIFIVGLFVIDSEIIGGIGFLILMGGILTMVAQPIINQPKVEKDNIALIQTVESTFGVEIDEADTRSLYGRDFLYLQDGKLHEGRLIKGENEKLHLIDNATKTEVPTLLERAQSK